MGVEGTWQRGRPAEGQRIVPEDSKSRLSLGPRRDLPLQPKAIIGREQLLAVARQRLVRAEVRLLTLTGPPGVGKTRLAWELASNVVDEFASGVRFIDLAPIGDPHLVIVAIARGLGLRDIDRRVVVEVVEEAVDRGEHVVEAEQPAPFDRAARVVEAELHAGVHVLRGPDALAHRERRLVHIPVGRFGQAEEIARAALFLASDESSFITGTTFVVDGGITAAYVTPE